MPISPSSSTRRQWLIIGGLAILLLVLIRAASLQYASRSAKNVATSIAQMPIFGAAGRPLMMRDVAETAVPSIAPMPPVDMPMKGGGSAGSSANGQSFVQRIIKTAELSLRVKDTPKAMDDVRAAVTQRGGFVESSSIYDSGNSPRTASLTVQIGRAHV